MQREATTNSPRRRVPSAVVMALFIIFQFLIIGVSFLGGYVFNGWRSGESLPVIGPRFPLLAEAHKLLEDNAYFQLPTEKALEYGMIKGMLQVYNEPFTVFVEPPQHELQSQTLQGKYGGIGVRIERDKEKNVYMFPVAGSPAAKAGVIDGDRLFKVDRLEITPDTNNDDIQAAIRGPVGQKVYITLGHAPAYAQVTVPIARAEVGLPSTSWNLVPDEPEVGIVHVHVMADTTTDEVTKAIKDLQQQGATRFIIDIRNNGGGLVTAGVKLARLFLKDGTIIEEQYKGQPVKPYKVASAGQFSDLPVVLLVNQGTASAAEIFAGALQGQNRALLVGTHTYGKDTIQLVFSLSDGSSLHVTAAHWWVPGLAGRITGKGLQPNVIVDENSDDSQAVQKAVETLLK